VAHQDDAQQERQLTDLTHVTRCFSTPPIPMRFTYILSPQSLGSPRGNVAARGSRERSPSYRVQAGSGPPQLPPRLSQLPLLPRRAARAACVTRILVVAAACHTQRAVPGRPTGTRTAAAATAAVGFHGASLPAQLLTVMWRKRKDRRDSHHTECSAQKALNHSRVMHAWVAVDEVTVPRGTHPWRCTMRWKRVTACSKRQAHKSGQQPPRHMQCSCTIPGDTMQLHHTGWLAGRLCGAAAGRAPPALLGPQPPSSGAPSDPGARQAGRAPALPPLAAARTLHPPGRRARLWTGPARVTLATLARTAASGRAPPLKALPTAVQLVARAGLVLVRGRVAERLTHSSSSSRAAYVSAGPEPSTEVVAREAAVDLILFRCVRRLVVRDVSRVGLCAGVCGHGHVCCWGLRIGSYRSSLGATQ
jgi:hypothetical protein